MSTVPYLMRRASRVVRLVMVSPLVRAFRKGGLLLVNTATCSTLYALGDVCCQKLEKQNLEKIDWARTARMALMGFALGPLNHFWYVFLDKRLPGTALKTVAKKVLCDQLFMAPLCFSVFYPTMGLLEGKDLQGCWDELCVKFIPTYIMDCKVWPTAQVINFFFVPPQFRVAYVNLVTLGWTVYLSYKKHEDYEVPNQSDQ